MVLSFPTISGGMWHLYRVMNHTLKFTNHHITWKNHSLTHGPPSSSNMVYMSSQIACLIHPSVVNCTLSIGWLTWCQDLETSEHKLPENWPFHILHIPSTIGNLIRHTNVSLFQLAWHMEIEPPDTWHKITTDLCSYIPSESRSLCWCNMLLT